MHNAIATTEKILIDMLHITSNVLTKKPFSIVNVARNLTAKQSDGELNELDSIKERIELKDTMVIFINKAQHQSTRQVRKRNVHQMIWKKKILTRPNQLFKFFNISNSKCVKLEKRFIKE